MISKKGRIGSFGFFVLSVSLSFLSFLTGCATHPIRTVRPIPISGTLQPGGGVVHLLAKGESVWRLAETYGVKADDILRADRITHPSELKAGTKIWIPGARQPQRVLPYLPDATRWQYIVVHHSATEVGNAELFDRGHRRRGFWNGLGYHFVIDNGTDGTPDGQIETGHRWNHQMDGAHCNTDDMNKIGIGICLVGNFDKDRVSKTQFESLVWLVRKLQLKYHIPRSHILRHRDVPGKRGATECPGNHFPWAEFQKRILSL